MKKKIICLILFFTVAAFAQTAQNPATIWCDVHNAQFVKGGVEFPSGVCYDVYTHNYYENRKMRTHKTLVRCPK